MTKRHANNGVYTSVCIMLCRTAKSTEIVVHKVTTLLTSDCRLKRLDKENSLFSSDNLQAFSVRLFSKFKLTV